VQDCTPTAIKPEAMTSAPRQDTRGKPLRFRQRLPMLLTLLGLVALAAGGLWWYFTPAPPPPKLEVSSGEKAKMESLSLTEIEEGGLRWKLKATKAEYLTSRDEIRIRDVYLEFYGSDQQTVYLWGKVGLVNTKTRDLVIKGDVKLQKGDVTIYTPEIQYFQKDRTLVAPDDVLLEGPQAQVLGKDLHIDLTKKYLVLKQHRLTKVKVEKGLL
jgi:LPS export ABC transporter protein LptC